MLDVPRLTSLSHGAGCACKLGPSDLSRVFELLGSDVKPADVLVAEDTGDDAAVYRLGDGRALVATVDVFTPLVDDAFQWGRIAAANALSDVYAMGGVPAIALNVAGWPVEELPIDLLADVLRGARAMASDAGVAIVGGHTITTERTPIFGLVALGFADPARVVRNSVAEPGMRLVLTKPIGTGLITTAIKRGRASADQADAAVATMTTLNADAAAAMVEAGAGAATDVTGFGLLGHLHRMLEASGCAAEVDADRVPLLPGVLELALTDVVSGGTKRNHAWLGPATDWGRLTLPSQLVLADAQTSGGLLVATRHEDALRTALDDRGVDHAIVGEVIDGPPGRMTVRGDHLM
jgi:selenide, water dikinase